MIISVSQCVFPHGNDGTTLTERWNLVEETVEFQCWRCCATLVLRGGELRRLSKGSWRKLRTRKCLGLPWVKSCHDFFDKIRDELGV